MTLARAEAHKLKVQCCFVLLEPTWMLYRVPMVSPLAGVTAARTRPYVYYYRTYEKAVSVTALFKKK